MKLLWLSLASFFSLISGTEFTKSDSEDIETVVKETETVLKAESGIVEMPPSAPIVPSFPPPRCVFVGTRNWNHLLQFSKDPFVCVSQHELKLNIFSPAVAEGKIRFGLALEPEQVELINNNVPEENLKTVFTELKAYFRERVGTPLKFCFSTVPLTEKVKMVMSAQGLVAFYYLPWGLNRVYSPRQQLYVDSDNPEVLEKFAEFVKSSKEQDKEIN